MENEKINTGDLQSEKPGDKIPSDQNAPSNITGTDNSVSGKHVKEKRLPAFLRFTLTLTGILAAVLFTFFFVLYLAPGLQEITSGGKNELISDPELKKEKDYKKQISLLTKDVQRLSKKYNSYTTGQSYIVINTTTNRFYLYNNRQLIRQGGCSTGSYTVLKTQSKKKWVFKTPRGKRVIQAKTTSPVWHRPDWSFVEEGLPIPKNDDPSRFEKGVLGDYALHMGDGYMIHGTIYKRFLRMPVTHGCVRLNDEDLEVVYKTLNIGSKVYIF